MTDYAAYEHNEKVTAIFLPGKGIKIQRTIIAETEVVIK